MYRVLKYTRKYANGFHFAEIATDAIPMGSGISRRRERTQGAANMARTPKINRGHSRRKASQTPPTIPLVKFKRAVAKPNSETIPDATLTKVDWIVTASKHLP